MSTEEFILFKYTCASVDSLNRSCNAEMATDRQDCECCSNRGEPPLSSVQCIFWPCTIVVDLFSCGPRYIIHKCRKTTPTIVEQPK